MKGLNWIIFVVGILELIAPFVLGFSNLMPLFWSNIIVGIVLIILGAWAALSADLRTDRVLDWVNAILGIWMIISPFVLGGAVVSAALWTNVILGIVALVFGVWTAMAESRTVTP